MVEKAVAPTPVLLPGKLHGWNSLVGYSPWDRRESDTAELFHFFSFYSSFWRRKWQLTPVFLPGESHGQRGLVGYSLWGCKESDTAKQLTQHKRRLYTWTSSDSQHPNQIDYILCSQKWRSSIFCGSEVVAGLLLDSSLLHSPCRAS